MMDSDKQKKLEKNGLHFGDAENFVGLPDDYFEKGKQDLKRKLESDKSMFDRWVSVDEDFVLVTHLRGEGRTFKDHYYCVIGAKSQEELETLFNTSFFQSRYDSTTQHFIADIKNKKIVKFLSVCM